MTQIPSSNIVRMSDFQARTDGSMTNVMLGMNTPNDPMSHFRMRSMGYNPLGSRYVLENYFRGSKLMKKVINIIPDQMTKNFGMLTLGGQNPNRELIDDLVREFDQMPVSTLMTEEMGVDYAFNQGQKNANRTGNGAAIILADDGEEDPAVPLNLKRLRSVRGLHVLDRWEIERDTRNLYQGRIEHFRLTQNYGHLRQLGFKNYTYQRIHESRVLWFRGEENSTYTLTKNQGCDDSALLCVLECYNRLYASMAAAGRMVVDYDVWVHKIDGLLSNLMEDGDDEAGDVAGRSGEYERLLQDRLQLLNMTRSIWNSMYIDMNLEDVQHNTRNVAGYDKLMERFFEDLQANTDLTPAELLGKYPTGMNATGKVEQENANERTRGFQKSKYRYNINKLLKVMFAASDSIFKGKEPEKWGWKWLPLYPMSPQEEAELELMRSQINDTNIRNSIYLPEDCTESNYKSAEFQFEMQVDHNRLKQQREEAKKAEAEAQQQTEEELEGEEFDVDAFLKENGLDENASGEEVEEALKTEGQNTDSRMDASTPVLSLRSLTHNGAQVNYQGQWLTINQPVISNRPGAKYMVLASNNNMAKLVYFGKRAGREHGATRRERLMGTLKTVKSRRDLRDPHQPIYWELNFRG